jgi:hypothetical protein
MELAIPKKEENKQWLESQAWNCQWENGLM